MARHLVQRVMLQNRLQRALHFERRAHTRGVGHAHMLHAHAMHEPRHPLYPPRGHFPFIRAPHRARDCTAHRNACITRSLRHQAKALHAFLNRAVDVLLAKGLAGRTKHHYFVRAGFQRSLKTLHIGREHRVAHTSLALYASHHLGVIRHLWHPLR